MEQEQSKDFFISYTSADRPWAEWIAWQLEEAGFTTLVQAWDFHAGGNFVLDMHEATKQAAHTIAVLSPDYFASNFASSEWAAAFRRDPRGEHGILMPVRVRSCDVEGLFGQIVYIDLVGQDAATAKQTLLEHISRERRKPAHEPAFPSQSVPSFPGAWPLFWNVPYPRNPFFVGRSAVLQALRRDLVPGGTTTALTQAIGGLGGIGKTQVAVEYAHRYASFYEAVLWLPADSWETLTAACLHLATEVLGLPEQQEAEKQVEEVKRWLQKRRGWLLILDNVEKPQEILSAFVPSKHQGSVLITTRMREAGPQAQSEILPILSRYEGVLFLLRRARRIKQQASIREASRQDILLTKALYQLMDGLPLALDQAGAYMAENGCSLQRYIDLYQQFRPKLLDRREEAADHPASVRKTFRLSWEQIVVHSALAGRALQFCAFLAPDQIPEQLVRAGIADAETEETRDALEMDEALGLLHRYSLVERAEQTLSLHRLVQEVMQEVLSEEERQQWMKQAVLVVNAVFPSGEHGTWPLCEFLLPHALICARWVPVLKQKNLEGARLLGVTGRYLYERAQYGEAEPFLQQALSISARQLGAEHPDTATSLNNLAGLYQSQGKYSEAEPLYVRALQIRERQLGAEHPQTARSLNNLAFLYESQGKYSEAEPLYVRALQISERQLGAEHPDTATSLNNLAGLYESQGKYSEAEPLYVRALQISERQLGAEHPQTAGSLNNLAGLYESQGKYSEAEPLYVRALQISERQLGAEHPDTATSLNNLAGLYRSQGKYSEAEPLYVRALQISERQLGAEHPQTAGSLNNLAGLYESQGKYSEAEPLYVRALQIRERQLGAEHPDTATSLNNLAGLYRSQGKYSEAEPLYVRALQIRERQLGAEHPDTATSLNNLAFLYQSQGKYSEAEPLYVRALQIRERQLGAEHPDTATSLNNLAGLYRGARASIARRSRYTCEPCKSVKDNWGQSILNSKQPEQSGGPLQEPGQV